MKSAAFWRRAGGSPGTANVTTFPTIKKVAPEPAEGHPHSAYFVRFGLLPPWHSSPGLGATSFAPSLTTLYPYDCTRPPGFMGLVDVGLSFCPEYEQIEFELLRAPV